MRVGLRIDVDTLRGTREGVPKLCALLAEHDVTASFFFSVGPDNMGRNLWRMLRPTFFIKMLRSRASRLYGWDILLRGTAWPGPIIGRRAGDAIKRARDAGHEMGLHAWDHYTWQTHLDTMDDEVVLDHLQRAFDLMDDLGCAPTCSAAPAWKCTRAALRAKARFPFRYNSDCRGTSIFRPEDGGDEASDQPQVPCTLPTYDEVIGSDGVTEETFNEFLLSRLEADGLNVLTIHAEVEGIACAPLFGEFLGACRSKGIDLVPLGQLLPADASIEPGAIVEERIPGRDGAVAVQARTGAGAGTP